MANTNTIQDPPYSQKISLSPTGKPYIRHINIHTMHMNPNKDADSLPFTSFWLQEMHYFHPAAQNYYYNFFFIAFSCGRNG